MNSTASGACVFAALLLSAGAASAQTADKVCMKCHREKDAEVSLADGTKMSGTIDYARFQKSAHGAKPVPCAECHPGLDPEDHPEKPIPSRKAYRIARSELCGTCHEGISARFAKDTHGRAKDGPVACAECHDPHYGGAPGDPKAAVSGSCAGCHKEASAAYAGGAHGQALLKKGSRDAPVCAGCHRAHSIGGAGSVAFHLDSVGLCEKCHGDAEKMSRCGLSPTVVQTYWSDFHGVSVRYQRREGKNTPEGLKATCVDCHGAHDIASGTAASSLAVKENLVKACRRCHEKATDSFVGAWLSHAIPSPRNVPLAYAARLGYWILIPFMAVGLLVHVVVDLVHLLRAGRPARKAAAGGAAPEVHVRFGLLRRAEHAIVILAFVTLMVTGLPQKFHDTRWAEGLIDALGGMDWVRAIHRAAGILFAAHAALHILSNVAALLLGRMRPSMVPARKDFADTVATVRHYLGLSPEKPRFDRYDFRQKFEYWGMLMGGVVMILSGFALYSPAFFSRLLPGGLIPVARVVHSFEAMMALLVIIIWHFYCSIFRPEIFPLDTAIFTGKISRERMMEEHALEYERLKGGEAAR